MSEKIAVFYTSRDGSTKQYAQWIAEACGTTACFSVGEYSREMIEEYDIIIFGSYIKMGTVHMKKFLINHFEDFSRKNLFMFTVGLIPLESSEGQKSWNAIPAHIREVFICHKKFSGRIDYEKLTFFEKILFRIFKDKFNGSFGQREINFFIEEIKEWDNIDTVEVL